MTAMRLLCLYFPRLSTTLARRDHEIPAGAPLVMVSGSGDRALVAGASVESAMAGVTAGLAQAAAHERCPSAAFLPDNANASLEALENVATILRARATPFVEVHSREHIVLDMAGLEERFADEGMAAARLCAIAATWSGVDVRAGVGDTIDDAVAAARGARRIPVVAPARTEATEVLSVYDESRRLSAAVVFEPGTTPRQVRASLLRQLGRFEAMLEGRDESARRIRLVVERPEGNETLLFHATSPLHSAAEAEELLSIRTSDQTFTGVAGLAVSLERLGPRVRVERAPLPAATTSRARSMPARPVQRRLLRAG